MAKSSRKRRRPFISSQKNAHTAHSKVSLLSIFCIPLKLFPQWTFHSLKLSSITDGLFQFKWNRLYSLVDSFESFSAPYVFSLSALYISIHILHTVHTYIFWGADKENFSNNQGFCSWWSFHLFSWPLSVFQGWYYKEKLDASHS